MSIYSALFIGTFVILVFAIGVILFFSNYRKRIYFQELLLEKKESEYRLALLKNAIEVTESERQRVASDLHDEIGAHLAAAKLSINVIKSKVGGMTEVLEAIAENKIILNDTIHSVRAISHNLFPPGLERFGLVSVVRDLCYKFEKDSGVKINFHGDAHLNIHDNHLNLSLYRIVQELFTNSFRHGFPKTITLKIEKMDDSITLEYADDGKGADIDLIRKKKGLGLLNIETRLKTCNGTITLNTAPGNGFEVSINIPIHND